MNSSYELKVLSEINTNVSTILTFIGDLRDDIDAIEEDLINNYVPYEGSSRNLKMGDYSVSADGFILEQDKLLSIGTGTLTFDGSDFVMNDSLSVGGDESGQSLIASGLIINNDAGGDVQDFFRVKSISNVYFIYGDVRNNRLGINRDDPSTELDVFGTTTTTHLIVSEDASIGGTVEIGETLDVVDDITTNSNVIGVGLISSWVDTGYIDFDLGITPDRAEGRLFWDNDSGTLQLGMAGSEVNQSIGQEIYIPRAKAIGSDTDNGQVVYLSGASGMNPTVSLAKADSSTTSSGTIAVATEDVSENANGFYTSFGIVRDIDTSHCANAGDTIYLSSDTAGAFTTTKPSAPNKIIKIGYCIVKHATEGSIFVTINLRTNNFTHIREGTENYVPFFDSNGALTENGNFTFDGSSLDIIGDANISGDLTGLDSIESDSGQIDILQSIELSSFSLFVDTDTLVVNAPGYEDMVGINKVDPEYDLDVAGQINAVSPTFPVLSFTRETATESGDLSTLSGIASAARLITYTSGNMGDGFGGGFLIYGQESGGTPKGWGRFYARRDGGDNNGCFQIWSGYNAGDLMATFRSSGLMGVGTHDPSAVVHAKGISGYDLMKATRSGGDEVFTIEDGGEVIFNEDQISTGDFTIRSSGVSDAFFMDSGNDTAEFNVDLYMPSDSNKLFFGVGNDMSIGYDGTDGLIDTSLVNPSDLVVSCGEDKTIELTEAVWDDYVTPLGPNNWNGVSNNPVLTKLFDDGSGSQGVYGYVFSNGDEAIITIQMPHKWKEGTTIYPHIHFMCTSDVDPTDKFGVEFEYTWVDIGEDFAGNTTLTTTDIDTGVDTDDMHQVGYIPTAGIDGTGHTISSILLCRIKRVAATSDDYAGGIAFLDFDVHYQIDTIGSRHIGSK